MIASPRSSRLFLGLASHDLDLLRLHRLGVVQAKVDVLYDKCPDLVTEAIDIEVAL
jgi:hypothetical protein